MDEDESSDLDIFVIQNSYFIHGTDFETRIQIIMLITIGFYSNILLKFQCKLEQICCNVELHASSTASTDFKNLSQTSS